MTAYLEPARPEDVSQSLRQVLEARGALVSEHRHSRVRFLVPAPTRWSWTRQGYAGLYQHLGEEEVQLRLILRARWPWRLLWGVAAIDLAVAIAFAATNPPGSTWVAAALVTGFALLVAALVYVATLRPVRHEERALMEAFREALVRDLPDALFETAQAREEHAFDDRVEAERTRRRLARAAAAAAPAPAPAKRMFSLRPSRKIEPVGPDAQDAEARRQALLARKAELEARRGER